MEPRTRGRRAGVGAILATLAAVLVPGAARASDVPAEEKDRPFDGRPTVWEGGVGDPDHADGGWSPFALVLSPARDGAVTARVHWAEPLDERRSAAVLEVSGPRIEGAFSHARRDHRIEARVEDGVLRGTFREGAEERVLLCVQVVRGTNDPDPDAGAAGVYDLAAGRALVIAAGGRPELLDVATGELRTLYPVGRDRYRAGPAYRVPHPFAYEVELVRAEDGTVIGLEHTDLVAGGEARLARRRTGARAEASAFDSFDGTTLRGTLHLPEGDGPHAAALWVHGSGEAVRADAGTWVPYLVSRGVAVLAVDKRGCGESEGEYALPGGRTDTPQHMARRGRDVAAGLAALRADPRFDPDRVGVVGASQAGWVTLLGAAEGAPAFGLMVSAAVTSLEVEERFSLLADELDAGPDARSVGEAVDGARRAGGQRFDAELAALEGPWLWLYGLNDRVNPSQLCVETLTEARDLDGRDFRIVTFPDASHALLQSETGSYWETLRLRRHPPRLFRAVDVWLIENGLGHPGG